ncbi:MarR family transcriptional regulator [Tsukamurella paurometabola]|uniref:MarR family transcriptional regulator n=1 Tax=Tsukamurella paurometabola TaxID=2061 RepID=UPI003CCB18DB
MSPEQLSLLTTLACNGAPVGLKELASIEKINRSTLTGFLNLLEQSGLVIRCPHPYDSRRVTARITSYGYEVIDQCKKYYGDQLRKMDVTSRRLIQLCARLHPQMLDLARFEE